MLALCVHMSMQGVPKHNIIVSNACTWHYRQPQVDRIRGVRDGYSRGARDGYSQC